MKRKRSPIARTPIIAERVRRIDGGFCFVPHRFLQDGFFASLSHVELLLYFLLLLAGDRNGVSFYGLDAICSLLCIDNNEYLIARNGLMERDLIAFDGRRYQVLSLPSHPMAALSAPLSSRSDFEERDPATIRALIQRSLQTGGSDE
jgi:hypothetical protein